MIAINKDKVIFGEPKLFLKSPVVLLDYLLALILQGKKQQQDLKPDLEFFEFVKNNNYVFTNKKKFNEFCSGFNDYVYTQDIDGKDLGIILNYLDETETLEHIFPELVRAKNIGQNKKDSNILYWHIMKLLEIVPNEGKYKWVALLHDLGKYYTERTDSEGKRHYYFHEHISYLMARGILYRFFVKNPDRNRILEIIKYHMLPLNYQRKPDWKNDAFKRYIEKCGKSSVDVAWFSIFDKRSGNNNEKYLEPLYRFYSKVKEMMKEEK